MESQGNSRQRLGKSSRLHAAADFVEIKKLGRRFRGKRLALFVHTSPSRVRPTAPLRLAVVISGKIGGAVVRNRWRRRLRELFRREVWPRWREKKATKNADFLATHFLVIVKHPGPAPSLGELRLELMTMLDPILAGSGGE